MLTRTIQTAFLAAVLLAGAPFSAMAQESTTHVDVADTGAEHHAAAERYESQARDFDKQAAEHEQMGVEYGKRARSQPKMNYVALGAHCDRFAKILKSAAAESRELAHLHGAVAKMGTP